VLVLLNQYRSLPEPVAWCRRGEVPNQDADMVAAITTAVNSNSVWKAFSTSYSSLHEKKTGGLMK
jgi:hypothetical protein